MDVKTLDPYQSSVFEEMPLRTHVRGPAQSLWTKQAIPTVSNNGFSTTITTSDTNTLVDRRMYLQLQFTVPCGANHALGDFALSSYPVNSSIQNLNVSINGQMLSAESGQLIVPMQRFIKDSVFASNFMSSTCTQLDPIGNLANARSTKAYQAQEAAGANATRDSVAAAGGTGTVADTFYAVDNPQSPFIGSAYNAGTPTDPFLTGCNDHQPSRGQFPFTVSGDNRIYTVTEPLLHPVFSSPEQNAAWVNINKIDIGVQFYSELYRYMFSSPTTAFAPAITVTSASIIYRQMTPSEANVPNSLRQSTGLYQIQSQAIGALNNGASTTVNFGNIQYATVPSYLYIYAKIRNGTKSVSLSTSSFLRMNSISLTIGNRAGILSGADTTMLYDLSHQNGLSQLTYRQWYQDIGSVLCIDAAKDLGLVPGTKQQVNVTFATNLTNVCHPDATNYDLYCISVTPGELVIEPGRSYMSEGFSPDSLASAEDNENNMETEDVIEDGSDGKGFNHHGMHGGKWYKKILRFGRKALRFAQKGTNQLINSGLIPQTPITMGIQKGLNQANQVADILGQGRMGGGRLLGSGRLAY